MRLLLIGLNYAPELIGSGKYTGELANWLSSQGHHVRVVTSVPYYPDWKVFDGFRATRYQRERHGNLIIHRCPLYVPKKASAFKRIVHLCSFSLTSIPIILRYLFWCPDLTMLVVPTLFTAPQALLYAKLTRSPSLIHVQDFEIDAMLGLGLAKGSLIRTLAQSIECFTLRRFNWLSTISTGMLARAKEKGMNPDQLRFLPNWSDIGRFRQAVRDPSILAKLGVDASKKVVLYSGNLGEKQGLEIIVECARSLLDTPDIVFLIVGDGAGKARLAELVQVSELNNVIFAPLQPLEELPTLLASADCHLVIQRRGAADAVMPSKLTNILAVGGNAVITADPDTSLGELCRNFKGIATLVPPESVTELVRGIKFALDQAIPNQTAQSYAEQYLDKDRILSRFWAEIEADIVDRRS